MRYALDGLTACTMRREVRKAVHILRSAQDNNLDLLVIAVRQGNVRLWLENYYFATRGRRLTFKDHITNARTYSVPLFTVAG